MRFGILVFLVNLSIMQSLNRFLTLFCQFSYLRVVLDGSILVLMLFLLYMNDHLPNDVCNIAVYVDDVIIYLLVML